MMVRVTNYKIVNFVAVLMFLGLAIAATVGVTDYLTNGFENLPPWM